MIVYTEIPVPAIALKMFLEGGGEPGQIHTYVTNDNCCVIVSRDPTDHGLLLHVSVSHSTRLPSWDQMKAAKYKFFGDRTAIMVFPRKELYVNIHQNCLHLWELPKIPGASGDWEVM